MTKVLIASFSQTGSTRKVADLIAKGLKNKSSFVFVSQGTHSGDCGNWIRRALNRKGSKDIGYFKSFGRDYWLGYIKRGILFSPDSPTEKELDSAEKFGNTLITRHKDPNAVVESFDPSTPAMYGIERMLVARPYAKLMYSKAFQASSECNSCGICIKKCPVGNITEKKDGKPKWGSNCMLCVTCELVCPKDAVHSAFDWMVFAPFMNYNIRKSKKKQIPYSLVEHSGGKTHMI